MIKNFVFDLGNVLLSWKPGDFLIKSGYNKEEAGYILKSVFRSPAWFSLDNGDITLEEAVDEMAANSSLGRVKIESLLELCSSIIFPLIENIKVLPALKKQGFKLYYLSNFPLGFFYEIKGRYDFFDIFDGGIISAEARASKPYPEIYRSFLDLYGLIPEECLYIDDIFVNVKAAEEIGMKVIHLSETDCLEIKLSEWGIDLKIASSPGYPGSSQ